MQNEEDAYQQQRRRLHAEVQEEKERVNVAVSFIGGGSRRTQRKPPSKSLTKFIT
jgi:hypothetical protein